MIVERALRVGLCNPLCPWRDCLASRGVAKGAERGFGVKERIGFIGVGLMGHGMAKNIVEKGGL